MTRNMWMTVLAPLALIGCDAPKPVVVTTRSGPALNVAATGPVTATSAAKPADDSHRQAAEAFLKRLVASDYAGAVEMTAESFRKIVSGPLTFEEERKLGYSNSDTEKFLKRQAEGATGFEIRDLVERPDGMGWSVRGVFTGAKTGRMFSLRLARQGDRWQVTRCAGLSSVAGSVPGGVVDSSAQWARESARDFLESLIAGDDDHVLTMAGMTEAFKQRLPSPTVADAGLKYSRKDVRDWLNAQRGNLAGYAISLQVRDAAVVRITGTVLGNGPALPFSMLLVLDNDNWRMDRFEIMK